MISGLICIEANIRLNMYVREKWKEEVPLTSQRMSAIIVLCNLKKIKIEETTYLILFLY